MIWEMAAPGQDHQPDQGQDHTPGQDQEPDQGQRTKPDQQPRRTCDGEKSRAGDVGQRRTAPDWTGPAWETDPPGLHKPDPDPRPDRGPLLVALRRRLKTASQDAHAGPAKEPDPDPARRAEGGFMRAVQPPGSLTYTPP